MLMSDLFAVAKFLGALCSAVLVNFITLRKSHL